MSSTVYVIDDEEAIRTWALLVAKEEVGCEAVGFETAEAFLAAGPPEPTESACLVVDFGLPGMSGVELLNELHRRGLAFSVVAFSGRAEVGDAVSFMKSGALTLLEKPCRVVELVRAIEHALRADSQRLVTESQVDRLRRCFDELTPRRRKVMEMLLGGVANKMIARELDVSERTIENDRAKLYEAFGVDSVAELAVSCTRLQLLSATRGRSAATPHFGVGVGGLAPPVSEAR